MSETIVKSTSLWLGKLLEEIKWLDAVRGKVEKLQTELSALGAFLTVAVKSQHQDEGIRNALTEAQNIAYDCEDVIDTYLQKVGRHGYDEYEGCHLGSAMRWACLLGEAVPVHEIGRTIDELNERISDLKSKMQSYGVSDRINIIRERERSEPLRRMYTHDNEECVVVGLNRHLDDLVKVVNDPASDTTVIAICGMGGIGKSTLARELYHHPNLREDINLKGMGWATASQQLQPDRVLRTLIYSLVPETDHGRRVKIEQDLKADRAHRVLYDLMGEFKCVVVIDDIWTSRDWAKLQAAFPRKNAVGSKVLLTTRNQESISGLDPDQVHIHHVRGLDEKASWNLFLKIAFPDGVTNADSAKKELGREMLRHCNGVPLAIVVLGKALSRKENWKQIHNDITQQIRRGGAPNLYKDVYDVLEVSFDELPPHLKSCFLYLANFPEDYEFSSTKLYRLWVVEGLIVNESPNESEEDIAERYLIDLVERNMVQVTDWVKGTDTIKTCRLHDLMRDVCIKIANKQGFLQVFHCNSPIILPRNDKNTFRRMMSSLITAKDKRLRRLAMYIGNQELNTSCPYATSPVSSPRDISRAPNLRSLLLFGFPVNEQLGDGLDSKGLKETIEKSGDVLDSKGIIETISVDYPLLRVFDCENMRLEGKLSKKIGIMIHLRYLGLATTLISELPESIKKLRWLQTLDLRVNKSVAKLTIPNVLWKMKQLKHVYLPDGERLADMEHDPTTLSRYSIKNNELLLLDEVWNLQTLLNIDLCKVDVRGLSKLLRLKTLKATCEEFTKALHPLLQCSSTNSFELTLHAKILHKEPTILSSCGAKFKLHIYAKPNTDFRLTKPLCLQTFPSHLVSLGIWYLKLDRDPLPVLEKLPYLADLRLIMCFDGPMMICSAGGFPQLVTLCFYKLLNFRYWEVERGALCKLKSVLMVDCRVRKHPEALSESVNVNVHYSG